MARSIWKGAISFGLVHIPVSLQSATSSDNVDFDWLDKRSMDPVGYKRVNKITGKEVNKENIVKGIQYEKGKYIVLSEDEIKAAHPKSTQSIDIFSFVENKDIPLTNIDTPYYLAPDKRGEKVYALLRETLAETGTVGLASVILHTKQHLAAVMAIDNVLVLILLRWPSEVRDLATVEFSGTKVTISKAEREMAKHLVIDMKGKWDPNEYQDTFQEKIMALVDKKVASGEIEDVETSVEESPRKSADIIDLTELLRKSLGSKEKIGKPRSETASSSGARRGPVRKTSSKAEPKKTASTVAPKGKGKTATAKKKQKSVKKASDK